MSVAILNATELGRFAAVCVKLDLLPLAEAIDQAARIHQSNTLAFLERYHESAETTTDREEIERVALDILADRLPLVGSFGPFAYNMTEEDHADIYELEKKCRSYIEALERKQRREEEDAASFDDAPQMATVAASEIVERCRKAGKDRVIYAEYRVDESDGYTDYYGHRTTRRVVLGFGKGKRESFAQLRKAAADFAPTEHYGPGKDRWTVTAHHDTPDPHRYTPCEQLRDDSYQEMTFTTEAEARAYVENMIATSPENDPEYVGVCGFPYFAKHHGYELHRSSYENRENYSMGGGNYLGSSRHGGWVVRSTLVEYWNTDCEMIETGRSKPKQEKTAAPAEIVTTGTFEIQKHHNNRKGFDFWLIPSGNLDAETFTQLRDRCKEMGGWYIRKWGKTPGGFAFKSEEKARAFHDDLTGGDAAEVEPTPETDAPAPESPEPTPEPETTPEALESTPEPLQAPEPIDTPPRASTRQTVAQLRESSEDFEWYPTTPEMLRKVAGSIRLKADYRQSAVKILDIGAGDGRALTRLQEMLTDKDGYTTINLQQFAIEKATVHLANMPKEIIVIGTDFHAQTLVDKEVDAVFCNPPYSEYAEWTYRILKECAAKHVYLVIPQRWRENQRLREVIERLGISYDSLGEYDFQKAERQARAKVEIVRFNMGERNQHAAFNAAIEEMLPELERFNDETEQETDTRAWGQEITSGGELIESLVSAYDSELAELYETYRGVVKINPKLLKEMGVTKDCILEGLRSKIKGLKNKYWQVLFENLEEITKKFATKQRRAFLESLTDKTVIDFTENNVRSMLIWAAKWSSEFFDEQLIDLFRSLAQHANIQNYKSNHKVFKQDRWRYRLDEGETHFKVDYRLVIQGFGGIDTSDWSYRSRRGLRNEACDFLSDFVTIANNLGFPCTDRPENYAWASGQKNTLTLDDGEPLLEVRAYKNGNLHIKVAKRLMLAINIQAGKLLGWLHSAEQAVKEIQPEAEDAAYVVEVFALSNRISASQLLQISHNAPQTP